MESSHSSPPKNNRFVILVLLPLASCMIASLIGILLGQLGNLFYYMLGDVSELICIPAYCVLFILTAGIAFLVNKVLRRYIR